MKTSEREVIESFRSEIFSENILEGIGDDAAVIGRENKPEWFVTSDGMTEGVHFLPGRHPPDLLGEKLVSINVSDILSMGGKPHSFLINIFFRHPGSGIDLEKFSEGIKKASAEYEISLIGGDTAASSKGDFSVSITMLGVPAAAKPILRRTASPGEKIYVTGEPGLSAKGLGLLKSDRSFDELRKLKSVKEHLSPTLPFELLETDFFEYPSSMIDISDGLVKDLFRICELSETGAFLYEEKIEILSPDSGRENILYGGEDYQLLFTVPPGSGFREFMEKADIRITEIGKMTDKPGRIAGERDGKREELKVRGYDHIDKDEL